MNPTSLLPSIVITLVACFAPAGLAQTRIDPKDAERYQLALAPGRTVDVRKEALKNVSYYNSLEAVTLLLDRLNKTFESIADLEQQRLENDQKLKNLIEPRMRAAKGGLVDYSGTEQLQEDQKTLGAAITVEEQAVRAYAEIFPTFTEEGVLTHLRKLKPKILRTQLFLVEYYGRMNQPLFTERLIELLIEKALEVRIAACEALGRHDSEHIPPQCYAALLNASEWEARMIAIDALARHGGSEAVALMVQRCQLEEGRLLTEITQRLERMTGQKLGKTGKAWLDWWGKNQPAYKPQRVVLTNNARVSSGNGKTKYWGIVIDSLRVVFVIDISGTMQAALEDHENYFPEPGKARIDLAKRELKSVITSLPSDAQFNIIAYNDVVFRWQDKMQKAEPKTKEKAFEWLDGLTACSATNIFDSLEMAFQTVRPGIKDKYYDQSADTIVFLSDGGPTAGRSTDCDEILAQVREWNRTRKVVLHTIGIGKQLNQSFMKALADQNQGEWRFIQ